MFVFLRHNLTSKYLRQNYVITKAEGNLRNLCELANFNLWTLLRTGLMDWLAVLEQFAD